MALTDKLSAIGDAIRAKTGGTELLTLDDMATEIAAIETGGGGTDITIEPTGNCTYRFAYNGWNSLVEALGDKITTNNITHGAYMFYASDKLLHIPFEINFEPGTDVSLISMFKGCFDLKAVPKINNCTPTNLENLFTECQDLREVPEDIGDWFDWSYLDSLTSSYSGNTNSIFNSCHSLRKLPTSLFEHGNPYINYQYCYYKGMCFKCYALDEIVDLPNPHINATWTYSAFNDFVTQCARLKNLTFKTPDGVPYVVNWKNQTIDLTRSIGYLSSDFYLNKYAVINYNSGITEDKQVTDATTYAALKNDPDWFTCDMAYSRYNHDSAVATINSLPDTSAYIAANGGTNTIQFKGAAGSATDGGAINTLTESEIAVAAAKGWTVTLS